MVRMLLAMMLALGAAPASADIISFYGEERTGTSGGQFLRLPAGARGLALGSGMGATARGVEAVFWNPAGLRTLGREGRFFASHLEYVADIDINYLGWGRRFRDWQVGLSGGILRSGDLERTTERNPQGTGQTFAANQFQAGLTVGRTLTHRITFAATVRFLQENLDDYENRAAFLDLGALYDIGWRETRIGFTVRNFGGDLSLGGTPPAAAGAGDAWQSFPAPTLAIFGFASDVSVGLDDPLTLSLDFHHPSDEVETVVFAGELPLGPLELRGGWRNQIEGGGLSLGFGLDVGKEYQRLQLGYGYADWGRFGALHLISLEVGP